MVLPVPAAERMSMELVRGRGDGTTADVVKPAFGEVVDADAADVGESCSWSHSRPDETMPWPGLALMTVV